MIPYPGTTPGGGTVTVSPPSTTQVPFVWPKGNICLQCGSVTNNPGLVCVNCATTNTLDLDTEPLRNIALESLRQAAFVALDAVRQATADIKDGNIYGDALEMLSKAETDLEHALEISGTTEIP